jgi:superfamily II DNA or RNA helicase
MKPSCEALPLFDHLLRPYQKEAQTILRRDWRSGLKKLLIEMPTGMGKTRTFVLLPRAGARTLVIVPRRELIHQTVKQIRGLRQCEADVEQADLWAIPETEFVVASWDTLVSNDRYKRSIWSSRRKQACLNVRAISVTLAPITSPRSLRGSAVWDQGESRPLR